MRKIKEPKNSILAREVLLSNLFNEYKIVEAYTDKTFTLNDRIANFLFLRTKRFDYMRFYKQLLKFFPGGVYLKIITDPFSEELDDKQLVYSEGKWNA